MILIFPKCMHRTSKIHRCIEMLIFMRKTTTSDLNVPTIFILFFSRIINPQASFRNPTCVRGTNATTYGAISCKYMEFLKHIKTARVY